MGTLVVEDWDVSLAFLLFDDVITAGLESLSLCFDWWCPAACEGGDVDLWGPPEETVERAGQEATGVAAAVGAGPPGPLLRLPEEAEEGRSGKSSVVSEAAGAESVA